MNNKKFSFITCVNDEEYYNEEVKYIRDLVIPIGFEVELIKIENAKSMASGYNKGLDRSDGKYKIYMHQDTFILNKKFLIDILEIFKDQSIGMIGMAGCCNIKDDYIWWNGECYGKVYDSHTGIAQELYFNEVLDKTKDVSYIYGLLMVTQYDIRWREEVFNGWHYYDMSQCEEFSKLGYRIVIPRQSEPWCFHDCGIVKVENGFEYYRDLFIKEKIRKIKFYM